MKSQDDTVIAQVDINQLHYIESYYYDYNVAKLLFENNFGKNVDKPAR